MDELISIVVPVYNVAPYLDECITSILHQSYSNLEIILVDDGSTDGSSNICDDYKKRDCRVKVIHQKNGGLTLARRAGANLSQGKYIGFVDGDDWIESRMYQVLYNYISSEKVDIVTSRGFREYSWGADKSTLGDTVLCGKYEINEEHDYILTHIFPGVHGKVEYINGAVWNKLFKSDIIKKILNEIDEHVHGYMDDTVCVVGSIIQARSIFISQDVLYHHRERKDSFTYSKNIKGLLQVNYGYIALKQLIEESNYKEKILPDFLEYISKSVLTAYNNMFDTEEYMIPQYFFKSTRIPESSKVLLYGAGKVGKSFWRQLKAEDRYDLVGIVDKNGHMNTSMEIHSVEYINKTEYDFIIIAVENFKIVNEIQKQLVVEHVAPEKVIWERPISIFEYFGVS